MSLIKWKPFKSSLPKIWSDDFFEEDMPLMSLKRLFSEGLPVLSPDLGASDIYEKNGNLVVEVNLPGMNSEDIDIEVENDSISITANAEEDKEDKEEKEGRKYYAREITKRSVSRTIQLPQSVKGKEAKADYEGGILKITVPKQESKNESIKIKLKK